MSKYTTELRYICEMKSGFNISDIPDKTVDEIITACRSEIFNFSYPIYEKSHKEELETKILKHYYTREICCETVGRWQLFLNEKMNLIMPKYNKLYKAEKLLFDKELSNIDITITHEGSDTSKRKSDNTRTDNLSNNGTINRNSKDKYSDTPQGTIANVDNDTYLSDYRNIIDDESFVNRSTGTQTNEINENINNGNEYLHTEKGYRGGKTYMELLNDFNEKVINIDNMIVNELRDLFFLLW